MQFHTTLQASNPPPRIARRSKKLMLFVLPAVLLLALLSRAANPAPAFAAYWTPDPIGTTNYPYDVSCVTTTFCKAVGQSATVIKSFNGTTWSNDTSPLGDSYWSVSCVTPTFCKAVAPTLGYSLLRSYAGGTTWTNDTYPSSPQAANERIWAVACASPSFCKAVGNTSGGRVVILSWNGSTWSRESVNLPGDLRAVTCVAVVLVCKAVGANGTILDYNGTVWTAESSGTTSALVSVSCSWLAPCKAVGYDGTIVSFNGSYWSTDTSGVTIRLNGVACVGFTFCKATGLGGTILSWDGTRWSRDSSGTTSDLGRISCVSTSFCKAISGDGTILSLATTPPAPLPVTISFLGCSPDSPLYLQTYTCRMSFYDSGVNGGVSSGQVRVTFLDGLSQPLNQALLRGCPLDGSVGPDRCGYVEVTVPLSLWAAAPYIQIRYDPGAGLGFNAPAQSTFRLH